MGAIGCARPPDGPDDLADRQALAILPFQVLDALDLPSQYERSVKMCPGGLFAQRYLLGVPAMRVGHGRLVEAARRLGMPAGMRGCFERALAGASMALFGFEDGPQGPVLKAYAEYRARLGPALAGAHDPHGSPPPAVELFRGFKWQMPCRRGAEAGGAALAAVSPLGAGPGVQTVYRALPGLCRQQVHAEVDARLSDAWAAPLRVAVLGILARAHSAQPAFAALWLDLGESDRPVRGFDLNLYDAGLRLRDITADLLTLAQALRIERGEVHRLLAVAGLGLLGHVSTGRGRDGQPYLTVYFEPADPGSCPSDEEEDRSTRRNEE